MITKVYSSSTQRADACKIAVKVSIGKGMRYPITGLPVDSIKECLTRIAIAIDKPSNDMPRTKLTINLAPGDIRKYGNVFRFACSNRYSLKLKSNR